MSKIVIFLIGFALFCFIPTHNVQAATFSVCTLGELTAAITTANSNTQADIINFNCSTTLNFTSALFIVSDGAGNGITINSNGNAVIFDGGNSTNFFVVVTPDASLTLDGFTLQNGNDGSAGAILNVGSLTISNSTFSNNTSNGGAIANSGTLTISNSTFSDNLSVAFGGAIANIATGIVTISNSTFSSNTAYSGGAIYNNGTLTINNSTFSNNTSVVSGSAIENAGTASSQNSNYINNTCTINPITDNGGNTVTNATGCPGAVVIPLSASATCIGADLHVTITDGDPNFQITADSGTLLTGLGTGTHIITGPVNETNVTVTELGGDTENFPLGDFNCFTSSTLSATATCNGADVEIVISNGNSPFTINVTTTSGVLSLGSVALGTYGFTGPDTFSNISVVEEGGDLETLNLPSVTCPTTVVVPPVAPAPILPPDPTALGCELTSNINLANAPDDTYCRILMKNGAVISYSGAIPAELISLGVIFAVDVYRLEGGRSLTEFPNYARVCLSGQGRLFYRDSRNAPRVSIELATETEGSLTCGWIPAPGTLILTN